MKSEFEIAITQLCSDRNLSPEVILEAISAALESAYKRNYGTGQNIKVELDPRTGQARVFATKIVVREVEDENLQMTLTEARTYEPDVVIGDTVRIETKPRNFGRIAAQTAKQVIMQRIREAERDSVYVEYADRVGEIANVVVRNVDSRSRNVTVNLGKAEAMLLRSEQIPGEFYRFGQRFRVYIQSVERSGHGPQIMVSRTDRGLLRRLLELEVPEIFNGTVEVKAIAREPGFRSKVAVAALQAGVDPVGSCVGMRGVRIQNIVNELNGEKIDVVEWAPDISEFIGNSLSPARVLQVYLNEIEKTAKVVVPDRALSLAIGKEGQNARLAAKLTGWRIDIRSESEAAEEADKLAAEAKESARQAAEMEAARQAAAALLAEAEAAIEAEENTEGMERAERTPLAKDALAEVEAGDGMAVADEWAIAEVEAPQAAETDRALIKAPEDAIEDETLDGTLEPVEDSAEVVAESAQETVGEDEADTESLDDWETWAEEDIAYDWEEPEAEPQVEPETEPEVEPEAEPEAESEQEPVAMVEEDDEDEEQHRRSRSRKDRRLEFDEKLGRVVARKRHKRSRQSDWSNPDAWEDDLDEE